MKVETGWLAPPQSIGGLDHLGTQAPCVLIYGQLLPGVTNVTDRARYYSLYPWLTWSFDQRYPKDNHARFIEYYRRADCLFTLIAERHARITDHDNERHGVAMVGRVQLVQALNHLEAGSALRLSQYTDRDSPQRYFKNPMGGLGQYYAGTLGELKLIDLSAKPWIRYTNDYGLPLAAHVDLQVPGDRFWKVIESDNVTLDELDALSPFCACRLHDSPGECQALTDLYFAWTEPDDPGGIQRRKTLALILDLTRSLPAGIDLTEALFRACIYSRSLPGGAPWNVPASLEATRACWATYQRNDLLSIACQTILALSLRELAPQSAVDKMAFGSVEVFAAAFCRSAAAVALESAKEATTYGEYVDRLARSASPIEFWENPDHEIQLAARMLAIWNDNGPTDQLLNLSFTVLAILAGRDAPARPPYSGLAISPDALTDYPINLASFRSRAASWRGLSLPDVIADLVTWCLNTHLRVALRKLRQTGRSTFHLRPSERGLEVVGAPPPPANTTPRFRQAVQILRDIGVLVRDVSTPDRETRLSNLGKKLLETSVV